MIVTVLFVSYFICLSQGGIVTVLFNMNIEVHAKDLGDANASIVYRKKGDFSSYGVDIDQYIYKPITSVVNQIILIKFPAIGVWKDGSVMSDVTFDLCENNSKKRRKSNMISNIAFQMWRKYGNLSFVCPFQKGYFWFRDLTFHEIKVPFMKYLLTDMDLNLKVIVYSKVRSKLIPLETISYIGGIRVT